jgi:hypothetical protein
MRGIPGWGRILEDHSGVYRLNPGLGSDHQGLVDRVEHQSWVEPILGPNGGPPGLQTGVGWGPDGVLIGNHAIRMACNTLLHHWRVLGRTP